MFQASSPPPLPVIHHLAVVGLLGPSLRTKLSVGPGRGVTW
jgi:hypothetical protein